MQTIPIKGTKKKVQVPDPEPAGKFETTHSQPAEPLESWNTARIPHVDPAILRIWDYYREPKQELCQR